MFQTVLVVCVGNICRSPTAEYLFRKKLNERGITINVQSAGLKAVVGSGADKESASIALSNGLSLEGHCSRQLTSEIIRCHDLILVMEETHVRSILSMAPEARGKVHLLGRWQKGVEVPDPYRQGISAHHFAYQLIEEAVDSWIKLLAS